MGSTSSHEDGEDLSMKDYRNLQLRRHILKPDDFEQAALELAGLVRCILSNGAEASKELKTELMDDVIELGLKQAFSSLQAPTERQIQAARDLLEAAEQRFPYKKKQRARQSHRQSLAKLKRDGKVPSASRQQRGRRQEVEPDRLASPPTEILRWHIFARLDARSLACAMCVSRLWRSVASDDRLWQIQTIATFGPKKVC